MSIKTHYALKQANETDNAQPSTEGSIPPCAVLFYPCDEGTGGTIACAAGSGATITGAPTLSWAGTTNTVTIDHDAAAVTNIPVIGTSSTIVAMICKATTSNNNVTLSIGQLATSDTLILSRTAATIFDSAAANTPASANGSFLVTTNDVVLVAAVLDGSGNYWHYGIDNTGTAYAGNSTAITAGAVDVQNNTQVTISAASSLDVYCIAMYQFASAIPSDYTTFLAELYANVTTGNKTNPIRWLTQN